MTRFKFWSGTCLLLAIISVGFVLLTHMQVNATSLPHPTPVIPPFQVSQTYVAGSPAIPVHTSTAATSNTSSNPNFSKNDVATFVNKHGSPAGAVISGAHLKILSIQFVTAKQASILMSGESVGRPDTYLVCYVKVQGPFQLTNVHAGPNLPHKKLKTTAATGDMVFDGHTGNLLVWGIY